MLGAFNQGIIPTIACFNKAKTHLGIDFDALISAPIPVTTLFYMRARTR